MHRKEKQIMHRVNKAREQRRTERKLQRIKQAEKDGMTSYLACACAEGFCEGEHATEEQVIQAWQYIHDTGMANHLQGFYGRTINNLINQNIIEQ
tara:strand:+ start:478 stop:762 length:285 start_codon:yes stop_codon:yes gene_type:complete